MGSEEKRETLPDKELVEGTTSGGSLLLRIPAHMRNKPILKGARLFEATLEQDGHGAIFIVFRKIPLLETLKQEEAKE